MRLMGDVPVIPNYCWFSMNNTLYSLRLDTTRSGSTPVLAQ